MRILLFCLTLLSTLQVWGQPIPGSLDVQWSQGAPDCAASPQEPLQVHQYEPQTYILRQNPCVSFEANFLYLLIGSEKALLIDTGAVADEEAMPLAATVLGLLSTSGNEQLPLLVVHSHGHGDHRAGDAQFDGLPSVEVIPVDLTAVQEFFGFNNWPQEVAQLNLGNRIIDIIPVPGHHATHLSFYDNRTQVLFTGDFLLPGRLYINDTAVYQDSAARLLEFVQTRPVAHILGGHIELDTSGDLYTRGATYHPDEKPLPMTTADLQALPAALEEFNGIYSSYETFVLTNPERVLMAMAAGLAIALIAIIWVIVRLFRRRRSTR